MLQSFSHDYPRPFPFDHWTAEAMLTIDYGSPEAGSAYHRHQRIEGRDIYSRIGRHDLTADVNFADLMSWGETLGWETVSLVTQREFLERSGVGTDLVAGDGVGEAFQVRMQREWE